MIAYVFKSKRRVQGTTVASPNWFGALRLDGEERERRWSLDTPDKREALRRLQNEADTQQKIRNGLLPPREELDARERPLIKLLEAFLAEKRVLGRSWNTLRKYRELRLVFEACGWSRLCDVSASTFCHWRRKSELGAKTLNDRLNGLKSFFEWLRRERMLRENPLEFVDRADTRTAHQYRRALTHSEAERLLASAPKNRAGVYLFMLQTGLRRNETESVCVNDFELDTPAPFVRVRASVAKNRREAAIPLRPEVVALVRSLIPAGATRSAKVFGGMVPRVRVFKRDLARACIPFVDAEGRRVDVHALRVTFGTNLSVAGVAPRVAMELMRHSDLKLTMKIYTDASQLGTAAAVASLPPLTLVSHAENHTEKDTETAVA